MFIYQSIRQILLNSLESIRRFVSFVLHLSLWQFASMYKTKRGVQLISINLHLKVQS